MRARTSASAGAPLCLVLAASRLAVAAVADQDAWSQGEIDTSEVDAALVRELAALHAEREPQHAVELAARLAPRLEAEAARGSPQRRASIWLALNDLYILRARHALAIASELDAPWVAVQVTQRECQVPTDPQDDWTRLDLMAGTLDAREAALQCAVQRLPGHASFWFSLGETQNYRLRLGDAVHSIEKGVELDRTNQAAFSIVTLRGRLGDPEGAIAAAGALHASIVRSPNRPLLIGMEGQAALVHLAACLRAGRRSAAAAVWRQTSWLIGRGEFCATIQDDRIVEAPTCEGANGEFPAKGWVQGWGKLATGPLDVLESKCDESWKALASAGRGRVVPETFWLPEEEEAANTAMRGGDGRWLLKMCSGSNSLAVHLLPANEPLGAAARAASAAAPHIVQRLVSPVWLTPNGHKADMRVHVIVAASSASKQCQAALQPALPHMLGASRIWVSRRGMLRVAPQPYDPTLANHAALVTSNPRHGRIRDPGANQLWDGLSLEAAEALHGRIRAAVGEVVRAAGYEPVGDGGSTAGEAKLYCNCEFVQQYALYGFDVIFEQGEDGLVPWILEATYAPDMRSEYAQSHSAAALHALREAMEADVAEEANIAEEVLLPLQERCGMDFGCEGEASRGLCARSLLGLLRERRHLQSLLRPFRPGDYASAGGG